MKINEIINLWVGYNRTENFKVLIVALDEAEAKEIADVADNVLKNMGFTRTFKSQVPNLNNASIFQLICRYEAVIDKDHWIYQN